MIVWLCIVGYVFLGASYARMLRNEYLDQLYNDNLASETEDHESEFAKQQYCLQLAKDNIDEDTATIFIVTVCGIFWPIAIVFYILKFPWMCVKFIADSFFASSVEKEIKNLSKTNEVSDRQRKELDEAIESAKIAEIDTKILEELRKSL